MSVATARQGDGNGSGGQGPQEPHKSKISGVPTKTKRKKNIPHDLHFHFIYNSSHHVGRYIGKVESHHGVLLELQFQDGTMFQALEIYCMESQNAVTETAPAMEIEDEGGDE